MSIPTIFNDTVDQAITSATREHLATLTNDQVLDAVGASAPTPAFSGDASKVLALRGLIGRKFTDADITPDMERIAREYMASYTGKSTFVHDVKRWARNRRISPKQVAGVLNVYASVLNVYASEVMPRESAPVAQTTAPLDDDDVSYEAYLDFSASRVGKGTYTVVLPMLNDRVTVRLGPWRPDKYNVGKKMRWISFRQGASYTLYARQGEGQQHRVMPKMRGSNGTVNSAILSLFNDPNVPAEAALAYAIESGRCSRCDRELTVPASIYQGYGPECIKFVKGRNE